MLVKNTVLTFINETFTNGIFRYKYLNHRNTSYTFISLNDTTHVFYGIISNPDEFYLESENKSIKKRIDKNIYRGKITDLIDKKESYVYFKTVFGAIRQPIYQEAFYQKRLFEVDTILTLKQKPQ